MIFGRGAGAKKKFFGPKKGPGPLSLLPGSVPALHEVLSIMVGGERSLDGCEGVKRC